MSAEKLEAVYLVDRQFFLHLKETESGFQYEAFHRSDKKENYSGMLTWEDLLESRIASPLAAARVAACEEIGLEGSGESIPTVPASVSPVRDSTPKPSGTSQSSLPRYSLYRQPVQGTVPYPGRRDNSGGLSGSTLCSQMQLH